MEFIKIGNYSINLATVSYIHWNAGADKQFHKIYFVVPRGSFEEFDTDFLEFPIDSSEGKQLKSHFSSRPIYE